MTSFFRNVVQLAPCSILLYQILLVGCLVRAGNEATDPSAWYKAYPAYPEYCSTFDQMATRSVPPLSTHANDGTGGTSIVHATVVIRHGARAPLVQNCWDGYLTNSQTGTWNCTMQTFMEPRPPPPQNNNSNSEDFEAFRFHKEFTSLADYPGLDVNKYQSLTSELFLKGTCLSGQLIRPGFEQHKINGAMLRDAYVYDSSSLDNDDQRLHLIDVAPERLPPWDASNLYLRTDNVERVQASAETLLSAMYRPEIDAYINSNNGQSPSFPLRTTDHKVDYININWDICPRLNVISDAWLRSDAYRNYQSSEEVQRLQQFASEEFSFYKQKSSKTTFQNLKQLYDDFVLDCLMTTICTDRPLPESVNDYAESGNHNSTFKRLYDMNVKEFSMIMTYNDAEYSKLAMGPLWHDIVTELRAVVDGSDVTCCPRRRPAKVSLYGAHDTTIMPLLASLGAFDGTWPPYASYMIIELHRLNVDGDENSNTNSSSSKDATVYPSDYGFRLLYNGRAITSRISACPSANEICDVEVLFRIVEPFATYHRDCDVPPTPTSETASSSFPSAACPDTTTGQGSPVGERVSAGNSFRKPALTVRCWLVIAVVVSTAVLPYG